MNRYRTSVTILIINTDGGIMDRFDIIRVITDIIRERNYLGNFHISYVHDSIIITLAIGDKATSKILSVGEVSACCKPRYKIRLVINDMVNEIRHGGNSND
jgi:ribosomal protein S8